MGPRRESISSTDKEKLARIQKLRRDMVAKRLAIIKTKKEGKNAMGRRVDRVARKTTTPRPVKLTNVTNNVYRIQLPEAGSFNPGLVKIPNDNRYIMVYRPDEYRFVACILDKNYRPDNQSYFQFHFSNCADPRLIWTPDNKLLMIYSSTSGVGFNYECIRGTIIMDLNKSMNFIDNPPFRVSPEEVTDRQKNWMPFCHENKIYLIASVAPHIIYDIIFEGDNVVCKQLFETNWIKPWIFPNEFLRGNTNAVQLEDGNYLGTFHTAVWNNKKCYYDNGCYLFEGKPPFKVLKCSNTTYLPAEAAVEPYFRNADRIVCTFPVGMVREGNDLLITYGDNDSCVKLMRTTVKQMMDLMVEVYND